MSKYEFKLTCQACPEQYDVYEGDNQVDVPDAGGETIYEHCFSSGLGIFEDDIQRELYLDIIDKEIDKYYTKAQETGHRNGNTLDNRKINLRVCTHKVNANNVYPYEDVPAIVYPWDEAA